MEVDLGRGLRADQWARFVGRHTCAEMIEQYSRTRLMDRHTPNKWSHDTIERNNAARSKTLTSIDTNTNNNQGFYSKFLKALPFKFARHDKNRFDNINNNNNTVYATPKDDNNGSMVNHLGTSTLVCSVGVAAPGGRGSRRDRVQQVPK